MARQSSNTLTLDLPAISLSGVCVIHCLGLPLLAAILPAAGLISEMEWVHRGLVAATAPVSIMAIVRSRTLPGAKGIALLAISGLALLIAGAFIEAFHDFETQLTLLGAVLLTSAHIWRWREHADRRGESAG